MSAHHWGVVNPFSFIPHPDKQQQQQPPPQQ